MALHARHRENVFNLTKKIAVMLIIQYVNRQPFLPSPLKFKSQTIDSIFLPVYTTKGTHSRHSINCDITTHELFNLART